MKGGAESRVEGATPRWGQSLPIPTAPGSDISTVGGTRPVPAGEADAKRLTSRGGGAEAWPWWQCGRHSQLHAAESDTQRRRTASPDSTDFRMSVDSRDGRDGRPRGKDIK